MFYEQYLEAQVSDDFAEIVKLYGERVTQAADEIMKETEKVTSEIGMNDEITAKDCKPISHDDAIEDKVIVIRGNVLRPEFRHASHQLMLCTGGFGAQKNARGRTCYCISLYSGKQTSFYRGDVLGVMDTPYKLRHVFDYSDTNSRAGRVVTLWQMRPQYEEPVKESLQDSFGEVELTADFPHFIMEIAKNAVEDMLPKTPSTATSISLWRASRSLSARS